MREVRYALLPLPNSIQDYYRYVLDETNGIHLQHTEIFFYMCALPGRPKIQIGLGYETVNGLQRKHFASFNVTQRFLINLQEDTRTLLQRLKLGPLANFFDGQEFIDLSRDEKLVKLVSIGLRMLHENVGDRRDKRLPLYGESLRDVLDSTFFSDVTAT